MMKVDLAPTVAAMLGVSQAAAAAMGVLAIWTTAEDLIDIPAAEQVGVGTVTVGVALALGLGCARTLTGQSSRLLAWAFVASLVISAYWGFLRRPAEEFPVIPAIYAVFPTLGLVLLAYSAGRSHSRGETDDGAPDGEAVLAASKVGPPAPSAEPPEQPEPPERPRHDAEGSASA